MNELGFGPLTGMAAALVAFTVSAIDALKVYVLKGWASKIPPVVFYILAIGIPTGVCIWLGLDWFNAITGEAIPESLTPYSSAATGIIVGIGASGSYKLKELGKAAIAAKVPLPTTIRPPDVSAPVTITPDQHSKPADVIVDVSSHAPVSQTGNTPIPVNDLSNSTQDTEQSASRLSDQTPYLSPWDREDVSGDNSQIGNRNSPDRNCPEQKLHHLDTIADSSIQYVPSDTTYPAYLMRFVDMPKGYTVLTPDGQLYRVGNGQVKELPKGWNAN